MHKIMNFIKVTYSDYMNCIHITWRSIGECTCIGGISKDNGDELLRSDPGCTNRKIPGSSTKFYRFPSDRSHRNPGY